MNYIFVDTGAWYALVDRKDPDHSVSKKFYPAATLPFITTNFVFDETITLLMRRLGWDTAYKFGEGLKNSNLATIITVTRADEEKAWEIFSKYTDTGFSYTDCTSFAVIERLKIDTVFTFDTHFKIMKLNVLPGK